MKRPPPDDDWSEYWEYHQTPKTGVKFLDKLNTWGPTIFTAGMFLTVLLIMLSCAIMIFGEAVRGIFA